MTTQEVFDLGYAIPIFSMEDRKYRYRDKEITVPQIEASQLAKTFVYDFDKDIPLVNYKDIKKYG